MLIKERLTAALAGAVERLRRESGWEGELPAARLDVPPSPELGDYSTDVAVLLARQFRENPAQVAERLAGSLDLPTDLVGGVDVAAGGFLNFRLRADWMHAAVREARRQGEAFGRSDDPGRGRRVQVEYVSADPTGPLALTHGRGAALGDTLANVLAWNGYRVSREFYINDAGSQTERFGKSLERRYLKAAGLGDAAVPVDGFAGQYVTELAERIFREQGGRFAAMESEERLTALTQAGRDAMVARQRETLERFGVRFDEWYSEKALHESGKVADVTERLARSPHVYEQDGALWLRSTSFGDTEDRPLRRSNGQPTYIASDLAYHLDKFERGFDRIIDIWGPEHEAHVGRTIAGIRALGRDANDLEILIFGPVSLRIEGMVLDASAPSGNNPALEEVLEEIGRDIARFFYLQKPVSSPLEIDLDLARRQTEENPARYVQRAYGRVRELARSGVPADDSDLSTLSHPAEAALMRKLAGFPDEVRAAARELDPHRLARYARELAAAFDEFRWECRLTGEGSAPSAAQAALAEASGVALGNTLTLLGMAPAPAE